jgi:hypothetical protein
MIEAEYIFDDEATGCRMSYRLMGFRPPIAGEIIVLNSGAPDEWSLRVNQVVFAYHGDENLPAVHALAERIAAPDLAVSLRVTFCQTQSSPDPL